jgi:3-hydroxybutyryl-CoA dehydratase
MQYLFEDLSVGQEAETTKTFVSEEVLDFARITGDNNPIHVDEEAGKNSIFGARVVHGAFVASEFSKILGTILPGEGCIYLSQLSSFRRPVYLNDTITAKVIVKELVEDKGFVKLDTIAYNQKGEKVIVGEALVKVNKRG